MLKQTNKLFFKKKTHHLLNSTEGGFFISKSITKTHLNDLNKLKIKFIENKENPLNIHSSHKIFIFF